MSNLATIENDFKELIYGQNHNLTTSENVEALEDKMLGLEQADCPVRHIFGPGIYIREVSIGAGVFSIGHHQKTTHLNHMVKGRVLMLRDNGETEIVEAPATFTSAAGRKIGLILEDMVWHNIYATDETDIEKLEEMYLDKSDNWKQDNKMKSQIDYIMREPDREDYKKMLIDLGVEHETVISQSENELDQIPMPSGEWKMTTADSQIQGKGNFATADIKAGEFIAPARINNKRTPAGRFTNHSVNPNAYMLILENNDIMLAASVAIKGCSGGDNGEEITIDYRQAVSTAQEASLCQE